MELLLRHCSDSGTTAASRRIRRIASMYATGALGAKTKARKRKRVADVAADPDEPAEPVAPTLTPDDHCLQCGETLLVEGGEALLVCPKCCRARSYVPVTNTLQCNEHTGNRAYHKRHGHFLDWMAKLQAKEAARVPDAVMTAIKRHMSETGWTVEAAANITPNNVRGLLKEMNALRKAKGTDEVLTEFGLTTKFTSYYNNKVQIASRLQGRTPPRMTVEQEQVMRRMYDQIQAPWKLYKRPKRKNSLPAPFVLHKCSEILGMHEFLPFFSLHEGEDIRAKHDFTWELICKHLGWTFFRCPDTRPWFEFPQLLSSLPYDSPRIHGMVTRLYPDLRIGPLREA